MSIKTISQTLESSLGLNEIKMQNDLQQYLDNPVSQLSRSLFDTTFDLLKNKIDTEQFEAIASEKLEASNVALFRQAYIQWIMLSIIKAVEADQLLNVSCEIPFAHYRSAGGMLRLPAPQPKPATCLNFEYQPVPAMVLPHCIVHSRRAKAFISLVSGTGKAFAAAAGISWGQEWLPYDTNFYMPPDAILLYKSNSPENLALVADLEHIRRPQIVMRCMTKTRSQHIDFSEIESLHTYLKPGLGTFVFSGSTGPFANHEFSAGVKILSIEYNHPNVESIIETLLN
jgi:hypothetical protein